MDGSQTGILADTAAEATGNGGNIEISNPNSFNITNNSQVAVNSLGQGNGGKISIQANSLKLDRGGKILASTEFGTGGNVNLKIGEILRLNNNGLISAKASQNASGGDLNIDAAFIVASGDRNSDIVANAQKGKGGNINITTRRSICTSLFCIGKYS